MSAKQQSHIEEHKRIQRSTREQQSHMEEHEKIQHITRGANDK